jgi:hypothetical protein
MKRVKKSSRRISEQHLEVDTLLLRASEKGEEIEKKLCQHNLSEIFSSCK